MKRGLMLSFVLIILSFIVFSSAFVSADAASTVTSAISSLKSVADVLPDKLVTQIFIFFIISLFVFSVLSVVGVFGNNKGVLFLVSFAVGAFSSYFMSDQYLGVLQYFYTAFGGTLMVLLPFVFLSSFAYIAVKDGNVQLLVMQHIAWYLFFVFLVYTLLTGWSSFSSPIQVLFLLMTLAVLLLSIFNSRIIAYLNQILLSARANIFVQNMDDLDKGIEALKKVGRKMGGSA